MNISQARLVLCASCSWFQVYYRTSLSTTNLSPGFVIYNARVHIGRDDVITSAFEVKSLSIVRKDRRISPTRQCVSICTTSTMIYMDQDKEFTTYLVARNVPATLGNEVGGLLVNGGLSGSNFVL